MDQDHMMLDKPIKIQTGGFKPGKDFSDSNKQIKLRKNNPLLTGIGTLFF